MKEAAAANIAKVVGVSKLKTKYEAHEAKRRLCGEYDLFCADERVIPQLPKLLGEHLHACLCTPMRASSHA